MFAGLRLKASRPKVTYVKTRSFKKYNPDALQYDMSCAPWPIYRGQITCIRSPFQ